MFRCYQCGHEHEGPLKGCEPCRYKIRLRWNKNKEHNLAKAKEWRNSNPTKVKARNRRNYMSRKLVETDEQMEKRRLQKQAYEVKNREKRKLKAREWKHKNYERVIAYRRDWYLRHKEKLTNKIRHAEHEYLKQQSGSIENVVTSGTGGLPRTGNGV